MPPLVLFLHGGFWRDEYDRTHAGPLAESLARHGYVVATLEYRRTGVLGDGSVGVGWPGTFEDVAAAVRQVPHLVADRTAVDLDRMVIVGHSAGGQLALWVAGGLIEEGREVSIVALAPVADLAAAYELDLDDGAVRALLGGGPNDVPHRYAATDPMARLPLRARTVVVHGTADRQVPVDISRRFVAAAKAAGDRITLRELSDVDHFAVIDPKSSAWDVVLAATGEVLSAV